MSEAEVKSRKEQSVINQIKLAKLRYQREACAKCLDHVYLILQKLSPSVTVTAKMPSEDSAKKLKPESLPAPKGQPQPIPRMPIPHAAPTRRQAGVGKSAPASSGGKGKSAPGTNRNNSQTAALPTKSNQPKANERSTREETKENPAYLLMMKKAERIELNLKTLDAEIAELTKEEENNNILQQYLLLQNMQQTQS